MRVSFVTLGCKVNQYESSALAEKFRRRGDEVVPFSEPCDAVIVNTCAVTEESERKSRQILRRARKSHSDAVIIGIGCMTQASGYESGLADIILGNGDKQTVPERLDAFLKDRISVCDIMPIRECRTYENAVAGRGERTRATVKIEDGCDNFCSYCLIPYLRGPVRSRQPEDALTEIRYLASQGYKEIVLTGIHLDSYGRDLDGVSLVTLLEEIEKIDGIGRVRLGSLEPVFMTEETVIRLASLKKLCPQFHLSLQSGCDRTLKAMNRHYTSGDYRDAVMRIRRHFPLSSITTDIIVGFPGETEEDFEASIAFAKEMFFAKIHVFPFSPRKGTRAERMEDRITPEIKKERTDRMLNVAAASEKAFLSSLIGQKVEILFESLRDGWISGFTSHYAAVKIKGEPGLQNTFGTVLVTGVDGDHCIGELISRTGG